MADAKIVLSAVDQTKAAFASAQRNLGSLADMAASLPARFGTIGLAIAAAFSAVTVKGAIDTLDRLDDMSEKTGIAVESLSALRYAGEVAGTPLEAIATSVKKLSVNMAAAAGGNKEASASFNALGISVKNADGSLRSQDAVLLDLADKFASYEDGAGKAAWAQKIFGKAGEEMIPLLNLGSAGIRKMREEAEQLGAVYGGDLAKEAAAFNDNLKKLEIRTEAAKVAIVGGLIPSLNELIDKFIIGRKHGIGFFESLAVGFATSGGFKNWGANLKAFRDEIDGMEKDRARNMRAGLDTSSIDAALAKSRRQYEYLKEIQREQALKDSGNNQSSAESRRLGLDRKKGKGNTPGMPDTKPPDHFADNFINQLITQYANLSGQMSKTEEVTRQLDTATEKFTGAQRKEILHWAELIDKRTYSMKAAQEWTKYLQQQENGMEAAAEQYSANIRSLSDLSREYEFQTGLLGKTAEQQERLNFERQIAVQFQALLVEQAQALDKGYISEIEYLERIAVLEELRNKALADQGSFMSAREARMRDAASGMNDGLIEYERTAARVGESMKNAFSNAFKGMEDALVSFVKTGKLDFASLADSIITDLIRIQVQQSVTRPLAQAMQGAGGISGLFGSAKSLFSFEGGGYTGDGSRSGGLDGRGGFMAMVHPRETVVDHTLGQGGSGGVTIQQTFHIDARSDQASIMAAIRQGGDAIKQEILRSRSRGGAFA